MIAVNSYWVERLTCEASLYNTLKNINCSTMIPGRCHPLMINLSGNAHEASRIAVRLRITTGTYILQCNRASYNQFESDATCNLCGKSDETLTHFLLECRRFPRCNVGYQPPRRFPRCNVGYQPPRRFPRCNVGYQPPRRFPRCNVGYQPPRRFPRCNVGFQPPRRFPRCNGTRIGVQRTTWDGNFSRF